MPPIVFVADYGPPSPPLFRSKREGLCPALLEVNKKVHSEASPLLYSDVWTSTDSAHIAPPKQALFTTSAFPSLPLTISGMVELGFTKRISKIWNSSEIPVQASLLSNYRDSPVAQEALSRH